MCMSSCMTGAICSVFPVIDPNPEPMVRSLLIRGMLAGFVAGLLVFGFASVFGEPLVDRAIAFESAMDEAKAGSHASMSMPVEAAEPELVSREIQGTIGLLTGVTVYSTAFGGLF